MTQQTEYVDTKAESTPDFDLLANFMWRRAAFLMSKEKYSVSIIDPCAGGGKLAINGIPFFEDCKFTAYEPDYSRYVYCKSVMKEYLDEVHNNPFEFHFSMPFFPEFNLAVSIPYTDRAIDSNLEKDIKYLKCKSYAYYVINRTLDVLLEGGYAIFALPKSLVDNESFKEEIELITQKAGPLSIESFKEYAIIILKKDVIK